MSNLFDQRANCTNFKLVGARQPKRRDRDAEGIEGGKEWGWGDTCGWRILEPEKTHLTAGVY